MKLKNKLLPLIGTAAVVATATPLALTSCKSNNSEWVDLLGSKYTPTIEKLVTSAFDDETANKEYFGDSDEWLDEEEVTERFYQDYLWSITNGFTVSTQDYTNYDSYKIKFNYVRFGQATTYKDIGHLISKTVPTISFEIEYDYQYTYKSTDEKKTTYVDSYKGTQTIVNLPYMVAYLPIYKRRERTQELRGWALAPDCETLIHTEQLGEPYYYEKIAFSYVDDYSQTYTISQEDGTTSTRTLTGEEVYYSGCFSSVDEIEVFTKERCPQFYSYYLMSTSKK